MICIFPGTMAGINRLYIMPDQLTGNPVYIRVGSRFQMESAHHGFNRLAFKKLKCRIHHIQDPVMAAPEKQHNPIGFPNHQNDFVFKPVRYQVSVFQGL